MEEITPGDMKTPERPQFLSVLCIMTFISSGLGMISYLIMIFFGKELREFVEHSPDMPEGAMQSLEQFDNPAPWLISFLLVSVSLYGAIQMFKLKKMGFHLYASANILIAVFPLLFGMPFSSMGLLTTAVFIAMYASNLKHMS